MRRIRGAVVLGVVAAGVLIASAGAHPSVGPFNFHPPTTTECVNVSYCVAVAGPWVVVPAHGEASFLMSCPLRLGYLIGGTDARSSSPEVHVWFDGTLGAPIGSPPASRRFGAVLLFHATSYDGKVGLFQPILGCVTLPPASKITTVSLVRQALIPGTLPATAADLRAKEVVLAHLVEQNASESCPRDDKLVGSWDALAFNTNLPPSLSYADAETTRLTPAGNAIHALFLVTNALLDPLAPQAVVQVGAACEP
jgi:hypothetical protein